MANDIKIKLDLVDSETKIAQEIVNALKDEINTWLRDSSKNITTELKNILYTYIQTSNTWQSLMNGDLKAHFGLGSDGQEKLNTILEIWLNSIIVDYKPVVGSSSLRGGFSVYMIQTDWEDVLSTDAAIITTSNGQVLPWLDWLLIQGDKTIIRDYEIMMKPNPRSRSGMATMVTKKGGKWRVPPEHAGTISNNFMTEILSYFDKIITDLIEKELSK